MEGEMDEATASHSVKYGQEVSLSFFVEPLVACCRKVQHTQCRGVSCTLITLNGNLEWSLKIEYKTFSGYLESHVNV